MYGSIGSGEEEEEERVPSYSNFAPPSYPFEEFEKFPDSVSISSISLDKTDRLRIMGVSPELIDNMRISIEQSCGSNSIQEESEVIYLSCHEFKLFGNPWIGQGYESVSSRSLLTSVLSCMAQNGWNLLQGADLSKSENDTDTLFFESSKVDPSVHIFAMSFNRTDRLRLIGAPESFQNLLRDIVIDVWKSGIQHMRNYYESFEIKLVGNPWTTIRQVEIDTTRILLAQIISKFRQLGYKLYASIDMSIGDKSNRDLDTFFFRKINSVWP